jgi:ABC-type amino acid transport substrate-binding protein
MLDTLPERSLAQALAPTGVLRASINVGNPILAHVDAASGMAVGVSVDIAVALAKHLYVPLQTVVFKTASESVDAVAQQQADVGFFAIDPKRGASIGFTAAYVLIEGCYLVRQDAPLRDNNQVDQAGMRVVVGAGSAYDLHLTRTLVHARIVRVASSQAVVDTMVSQGLNVAAGIKQPLEDDVRRLGGLRLLPGRFMVIQQAMALAKDRGEPARVHLAAFVEHLKATGFVAQALARHGVHGATVAPTA